MLHEVQVRLLEVHDEGTVFLSAPAFWQETFTNLHPEALLDRMEGIALDWIEQVAIGTWRPVCTDDERRAWVAEFDDEKLSAHLDRSRDFADLVVAVRVLDQVSGEHVGEWHFVFEPEMQPVFHTVGRRIPRSPESAAYEDVWVTP